MWGIVGRNYQRWLDAFMQSCSSVLPLVMLCNIVPSVHGLKPHVDDSEVSSRSTSITSSGLLSTCKI